MDNRADITPTLIKLPSDQDASGRSLAISEVALLGEALRSGTLTSTKGTFVRSLQNRFAAMLSVSHAYACASGTAAVHCAVAALDPEPGDEIVTSPITDMGALAPILYQGAIPVFADVEPAHVQRHRRRRSNAASATGPRRSSSRTCSAIRAT